MLLVGWGWFGSIRLDGVWVLVNGWLGLPEVGCGCLKLVGVDI